MNVKSSPFKIAEETYKTLNNYINKKEFSFYSIYQGNII